MTWFEQLEIHLRDLYLNNSSYAVDAFKLAFRTFFDEEHQTFRLKMFLNLDQLRLQLERENIHEVNAKTCLEVLRTQFREFFTSKGVNSSDHLNQCWQQDFKEYMLCKPDTYRRDLLENLDTLEAIIHRVLNEEILHEHEIKKSFRLQSQDVQINPVQAVDDSLIVSKSSWIDSENNNALSKSMNETQLQQHESLVTESTTLEANLNTDVKALDVRSIFTESSETKSGKHDISSSSRNYITHAMDADIRLVNDQVPFAEEKRFTIASLKNELRKLIGNSVNTKFAKPSTLRKPVLQPLRNQSFIRQPTAFRSERPKFPKLWCAFQVDVKNYLPKPVTPHYLPKVRESVFVKLHHVIASGSSRNSSKESYGSNDIAHNYYLEEAKKNTQDKNTNLKPRVMHTTSLQNTTNSSKPNPRSNNQVSRSLLVSKSSCGMSNAVPLVDHSRNSSSFSDSKHFICLTCQKCIFNANHGDCITKFLKEVNYRAKVQSLKTRNNNKPINQIILKNMVGRFL
uniref:Integrase, catalytic region, zinc finger, CCHC-type, peptidase aspartic, catalytic n=1 Tax=Tanacetum cinerariifolium TaxID=118510 RepID=A0A699HPA6_TANCI|nr:hypothetical protein [Tanacetum cinerariifolium]